MILFKEAVRQLREGRIELARQLVRDADELRKRARLKKPLVLRRYVCKNCGTPLVPGLTATYRLRREGSITRLVVACLICGYKHRYVLRNRRVEGRGELKEAEGAGTAATSRRYHR
jgi:ribonuclease P protein subunit RPR2